MKYIRFVNTDGIGRQLITHNKMRDFAKKYNLQIIFDFRDRNYFRGEQVSLEKVNNYFELDSECIYDFDEIDKIPRNEIINIGNSRRIEQIYGNADQSKTELDYVSEFRSQKNPKLNYLFVRPKNLDICFGEKIKNSIGVHARLGNGEFEKIDHHRAIGGEVILQKMIQMTDDKSFFVCSDTKEFIQSCKDRFKDRIICYERNYVKKGWGPGHNVGYKYKKNEDGNHNSYQTLHDALSELYFLSLTKKLIHTGGSFTKFAIDSNVPHTNLRK
jgi:hypothetical protein